MPKTLAIIGATASGKSQLAVDLALKLNAYIFSIDSLAVYKEMDIVSAKPSLKERQGIVHFGIDALTINEDFSVAKLITLYKEAQREAEKESKALIIVGGSSFYLKSLIEGLSTLPTFDEAVKKEVKKQLKDPEAVYTYLQSIDPQSIENISKNDSYRLEKLLLIALQTKEKPSRYFKAHPPQPVLKEVSIFNIVWEREALYERINMRTKLMLKEGLIDEIATLESKYGRAWAPMKAIGVIETLGFLDGRYDKEALEALIAQNTRRLAKRQSTFNRTQFEHIINGTIKEIYAYVDTMKLA